ncbi:PREDICTED: uncharacterized protein LOC105461703 isoform X2 [Wasmannia auropunctata]|uniref:uncharacterized protein LOC105461703 isoform X2 n=1 Tax=Wasmannia auropunctata TaxID=64793 RepID=UPI0005EE8A29|nr:PREDICTED: uncharacterized protein LOC105461703 isoform X2 [Wasmannia auropunctata]
MFFSHPRSFRVFNITLLPPTGKNEKEKGKLNNKECKGSIDQNVFQKNLVVENPKQRDILHESGCYCQNTKHRRFKGDVLGYCSPVSNIYYIVIGYCNIVRYIYKIIMKSNDILNIKLYYYKFLLKIC